MLESGCLAGEDLWGIEIQQRTCGGGTRQGFPEALPLLPEGTSLRASCPPLPPLTGASPCTRGCGILLLCKILASLHCLPQSENTGVHGSEMTQGKSGEQGQEERMYSFSEAIFPKSMFFF